MRLNTLDRLLLFASDIHARLLRSSSNFQLYTPKPHLEIYRNTFVLSGSSVWNSFPSYIHNSNSVHHFKAQYLCWVNPNVQGHLQRISQHPGCNACIYIYQCICIHVHAFVSLFVNCFLLFEAYMED